MWGRRRRRRRRRVLTRRCCIWRRSWRGNLPRVPSERRWFGKICRGWVLADSSSIAEDYRDFLRELKEGIVQSQVRAVLSVNCELVLLYWPIGRNILNRQQQRGWGAKVIDHLAVDLETAFPERMFADEWAVGSWVRSGGCGNGGGMIKLESAK